MQDATNTAEQFASAYGSYRWNEDPRQRLARLRAWASPELVHDLSGLVTAPGLISDRRRLQQDATADASATSIRALTAQSITFVVAVQQHTRERARTETATHYLAVEVARDADRWQVQSLQPATLTDGDFQ